jgi:hypothetical protein
VGRDDCSSLGDVCVEGGGRGPWLCVRACIFLGGLLLTVRGVTGCRYERKPALVLMNHYVWFKCNGPLRQHTYLLPSEG